MMSFVKQKVLSSIPYLLLIVCLHVDLSVSSLKIFFCVDGFKLFPSFSSIRFKVSCLMLKFLIHLKLRFVHLIDIYIFIFILLHEVTQHHLLTIFFFQCVCYSLVFIKKTGICRYMEFYWTYNLQFDFIYQWVNFVFQCYAVSITIALKYSLKSVRMIHASVLILLEIILAILGFLCFHMMSTFFSILVKNWLHLVFN